MSKVNTINNKNNNNNHGNLRKKWRSAVFKLCALFSLRFALFGKERERMREREPLREIVSRNGMQRKHKTAERYLTKTYDRVRVT